MVSIPKLSSVPSGVSGVVMGFAVGFIVDRIVEYIMVNYVSGSVELPSLPIFAVDDWILIILGLILTFKKPAFGGGFLAGVVLSSGIIPRG